MKAVVCNSDFGVKASDRHVCSTDQLHMFTSVSFAIFTSLHLHNSAHIIFISSQLLILTSANLHIFSLSSADLHIFTSSLSLSLTLSFSDISTYFSFFDESHTYTCSYAPVRSQAIRHLVP